MNQHLHALPTRVKSVFYFTLFSLLTFISVKSSGQFTSGNVVVLQVGDGSAALSSAATPLFLKEFTTTGSAGISVTIPATGSSALTSSGSATSEGLITRSSDGSSIIIPGYNTASGFASVASSSTTTTPGPVLRAIGKVNAAGTFSLPATTTSYSGNNTRGATSNGTSYWATGANTGIVLESSGAGTIVSSTSTNTRSISIYNGNLYYSTGSGTTGIYQVGTGLPTSSGNTSTLLFSTQSSPYQFAINAAGNVAYVADDSKGIYKYTLSGGTWTGAVLSATACRGLIVDFSGTNPIIYATTTTATANSIIKIIDNGSAITSTVATAAANTVFRGIAFSPAATVTTYTITATQSANGSITPTGTTTVNSGSNQTYTITPNTGYHVATLTVDGASVTPATSYTFSNVTANHTITATFAINTFTITATQSTNGSITPTGVTTVNYGSSQTYAITPNTGYSVATLTVDGTAVTPATSYTFSNVTANHTITATFAINTFTITATQSANGTITPSGTTTVNYGGSQTYTITPNTGYSVATLTVDGTTVTPATSYTFSNVTANHTITVTFAINTYTITSSAGTGGSITPNGTTSVNYGGSQTYTITPNTCNSATVLVDGIDKSADVSNGSYTFSNVTANHTISVTFGASTFSLNSGIKNPNCDSAGNPDYSFGSFYLSGVGGTAPYTYAFNQGNTINTPYVTQQSYPGIPANVNYTLSVKDATGCIATKTKHIAKILASLSVSGNDPSLTTEQICYGRIVAVFPSVHPGTAPFTWSINGAAYTDTRPVYEPAGTYSAVAKDALGCVATTNSVVISQSSAPVSFTTQIQHGMCGVGRNVIVTASGGYGTYGYLLAVGAQNYSGTYTSGGSSYTFTNVTPGTYTISVIDSHGCGKSNVIQVADDPSVAKIVVVTNTNTVPAGSTVTFGVNPIVGVNYTWVVPSGDQVVAGQGTATAQINWVSSGYLRLTATASCSPTSSLWQEYVTATSSGGNPAIAETMHLQQSKLNVFPNPVSNVATVVYTATKQSKYTLIVTDVTGKPVVRQDGVASKGDNIIKLNVANYVNGMYILRLSDDDAVKSIRLIKSK